MREKLRKLSLPFWCLPLLLLIFSFLSYGILSRKLGIYWDDWAYLWTRLELGYEGLLRHFSFSRPVAGQIHNLAMLLTGKSPERIQLFGMVMRAAGAAMVALLIRRTWKQNFSAAAGALLFIAYPGFTMQPIAINFSFSYFLIGILCLSFVLTLEAERHPVRRVPYTIFALLLAAVNLFASEYFFLLELLRPLFIWITLRQDERRQTRSNLRAQWGRTLKAELPYAVVFLSGTVYRAFFNRTQTLHYEFSLLESFQLDPAGTIGTYLGTIFSDCFKVLVSAWLRVFEFPDSATLGRQTFLAYGMICVALALLTGLFLAFLRKSAQDQQKTVCFEMIGIGAISLLLAGQPFWLTGTYLSFVFQNSRYTLPFMLGVSLIGAGLLSLIRRPRILAIILTAVFVGLAGGSHFVNANEYRRDWTLTKDFFWQLKWRVPTIAENTVVITNVLPIRFSTDNSLTAALNWIYADREQNPAVYADQSMPYMLYTNTKRENTLGGIQPGQPIFQEYLSAQFNGSTDDAISLYYNAPGCMRVLDPEVDLFNQTIPIIDREAALLNSYDRILTAAPTEPLDTEIFGTEPAHGWCWYYEQADLSRQRKDWQTVAALGAEAFALSDHPNDPMERLPFIEGYAHVADWDEAAGQTQAALAVTPVMNNPLCALWNRIERETADSNEKTAAINEMDTLLDCRFLK